MNVKSSWSDVKKTFDVERLWNIALSCKVFLQSRVEIYDRLLFSMLAFLSKRKTDCSYKSRVYVLIDSNLSRNKKETDCWELIECSECENREKTLNCVGGREKSHDSISTPAGKFDENSRFRNWLRLSVLFVSWKATKNK